MSDIKIEGTITIDGEVVGSYMIGNDYFSRLSDIAPDGAIIIRPFVRAMIDGLAAEELLTPDDEQEAAPWEM